MPNTTHIVLNAKKVTDGQHGAKMHYSSLFYMILVDENNKRQMKKVKFSLNGQNGQPSMQFDPN